MHIPADMHADPSHAVYMFVLSNELLFIAGFLVPFAHRNVKLSQRTALFFWRCSCAHHKFSHNLEYPGIDR